MLKNSRILQNPVLIAAIVSLAISLFTALIAPLPAPQFHDEFSYLLAADTFAHGRLTNPSHALWQFFETFHVLVHPTYASKYPPALGLLMALGQVMTGLPIVGVWIATALACAASAWMLRAVASRKWTTVGAILIAIHPLVLGWDWNYWGGSVTMIGGALLLGAALRLRKRASIKLGIITGCAISILANSRPIEGAILTILIFIWLLMAWFKHRGKLLRIALPMCVPLALTFMWMGYYNWRVTGHVMQMPYAAYEHEYAPTRPFAWLPPPASMPTYRHRALREFFMNWEYKNYVSQRSVRGFAKSIADRIVDLILAYAQFPLAVIALWGLPFAARQWKWMRGGIVIASICALAALPTLTFFPHYTAQIAALIFALAIASMRWMWLNWRIAGKIIVAIIVAGQLFAAISWLRDRAHTDTSSWQYQRLAWIEQMKQSGRRYLIFVRPVDPYYPHNEFVENSADIDAQTVVWARDMGDAENRKLVDYYQTRMDRREVELFEISTQSSRLIPYNP